jgi:hypothetical protein
VGGRLADRRASGVTGGYIVGPGTHVGRRADSRVSGRAVGRVGSRRRATFGSHALVRPRATRPFGVRVWKAPCLRGLYS